MLMSSTACSFPHIDYGTLLEIGPYFIDSRPCVRSMDGGGIADGVALVQ